MIQDTSIRPAPTARWSVEDGGIFITNLETGEGLILGYPEAAIWDLFTRDADPERIAAKTALIAAITRDEANRLIEATLQALEALGLVVRKEHDG